MRPPAVEARERKREFVRWGADVARKRLSGWPRSEKMAGGEAGSSSPVCVGLAILQRGCLLEQLGRELRGAKVRQHQLLQLRAPLGRDGDLGRCMHSRVRGSTGSEQRSGEEGEWVNQRASESESILAAGSCIGGRFGA